MTTNTFSPKVSPFSSTCGVHNMRIEINFSFLANQATTYQQEGSLYLIDTEEAYLKKRRYTMTSLDISPTLFQDVLK